MFFILYAVPVCIYTIWIRLLENKAAIAEVQ